ncbi:MAG: hypothetical protein EMLJLAPB_00854 [Candidatus Argoarchaeum ethanivorans]|uniref:Uncharacterized protein n=1 Tax=Candidatus Argoarchaeum ethanivorans TaxID=2608793 RepID=A0A811TFU5_9EURY|nr:MAG: hypothetical protein EMLJLAPB_00854 [Candidatus Argoarchaeum ethanivorans]
MIKSKLRIAEVIKSKAQKVKMPILRLLVIFAIIMYWKSNNNLKAGTISFFSIIKDLAWGNPIIAIRITKPNIAKSIKVCATMRA